MYVVNMSWAAGYRVDWKEWRNWVLPRSGGDQHCSDVRDAQIGTEVPLHQPDG